MASVCEVRKKPKLSKKKKAKIEQLIEEARQAFIAEAWLEAHGLCQQMLEIDPECPEAFNMTGLIADKLGDTNSALKLLTVAAEKSPDSPYMWANLAGIHAKLEDNAAVQLCWERYTELEPSDASGWGGLAEACFRREDYAAAQKAFRRYTELEPSDSNGWRRLAVTCHHQKQYRRSIEALQKALELDSENADEIYRNLAVNYSMLEEDGEAERYYRKALEINPDDDEALHYLGKILLLKGSLDEARAMLRKSREINPRNPSVHKLLLTYGKVESYDEVVKSAEELYKDSSLSSIQQAYLAFGLGKAWNDLGDYDKSFAYYAEGNKIRRESREYNIEDDRRDTEEIMERFSKELLDERCEGRDGGEELLFVVGMPRSGSTLTEQILSSHPDVKGLGESDLFRDIVGYIALDETNRMNLQQLLDAPDGKLKEAGNAYINNVRRRLGKSKFYVDKTLPNLWFLGMIRLIFPKARILHCSRNPLDNCYSIFTHDFQGGLFRFGYDLTELGQYYRLYQQMMVHWREVLPDDVFRDVVYEDMVADPEAEIRSLLDFCDLEWNEACMNFHKNKRRVKTSSLEQVRKPIYRSSVNRWEPYREHLKPLIEALEGREA